MKEKEDIIDYDELLTTNTALQNTAYYRRIKLDHDHEGEVRKLAHKLYTERIEKNIEGNALADWFRAKSILLILELIV